MQRSLKPQSTGQHRGDPPITDVAQQRQALAHGQLRVQAQWLREMLGSISKEESGLKNL